MSTRVLIKGGLVARSEGAEIRDVALEDGKIADLSAPGASLPEGRFDRVIDAGGLVVLPGAIDAHVHFRTPGGEHKEDWKTASMAALAGGVTTVLDMPNTDPPTVSLSALADKRKLVSDMARVNWGLFMGATADNLKDVEAAENIAGLKVYMGSTTGGLLVHEDQQLTRIFREFEGFIGVHAEDEEIIRENSLIHKAATEPSIHGRIRTILSAKRATERAIALAKRFSRPLHICHMSTAEELLLVRAAGQGVTCEVAPHHLMLTEEKLDEIGTLAKMNPPLRTAADTEALWEGLADGAVTCVATDHAPHTLKEKMGGYWEAPSGVPGVQHMLPILLDGVHYGKISLERLVQVTAEGPAALFGIAGKGRIAPGYDADLVLAGMGVAREVKRADVLSKCGWTPYEGMELYGWPVLTLMGGEVVYDHGEFPATVAGREVTFARSAS